MCGIVGYIGERDAAPILLDGLRRLEYRGYDSAAMPGGNGPCRRAVMVQRAAGNWSNLAQRGSGASTRRCRHRAHASGHPRPAHRAQRPPPQQPGWGHLGRTKRHRRELPRPARRAARRRLRLPQRHRHGSDRPPDPPLLSQRLRRRPGVGNALRAGPAARPKRHRSHEQGPAAPSDRRVFGHAAAWPRANAPVRRSWRAICPPSCRTRTRSCTWRAGRWRSSSRGASATARFPATLSNGGPSLWPDRGGSGQGRLRLLHGEGNLRTGRQPDRCAARPSGRGKPPRRTGRTQPRRRKAGRAASGDHLGVRHELLRRADR